MKTHVSHIKKGVVAKSYNEKSFHLKTKNVRNRTKINITYKNKRCQIFYFGPKHEVDNFKSYLFWSLKYNPEHL